MRALSPSFLASALLLSACSFFQTAENPDPNHTHADFAVWIEGTQLDFSGSAYMSGSSDAEEEGEHPHTHLHEYLHLHDGNGHVIHRHKPGLPIGDFFTSIGLPMTKDCLTLDTYQFSNLDAGWKNDFGVTKNLCNNGKFHWTMVVNGQEHAWDPGYFFNDNDRMMLIYSAADDWSGEWKQMTGDACLYSKTCPWRGKPPAEGCIADPTVPCTE